MSGEEKALPSPDFNSPAPSSGFVKSLFVNCRQFHMIILARFLGLQFNFLARQRFQTKVGQEKQVS